MLPGALVALLLGARGNISCIGIIVLNIDAESVSDLVSRLCAIDITVSLRTEGRTTEQCERWLICRLLSTFAETDSLAYPLKTEKPERPDFLLSLPSRQVGIEITEAVPPDWAWANASEKLSYENMVFLQRFKPGKPQGQGIKLRPLRVAPAVVAAGGETRLK